MMTLFRILAGRGLWREMLLAQAWKYVLAGLACPLSPEDWANADRTALTEDPYVIASLDPFSESGLRKD
jgi:hypothetical protein